MKAIFYVLGLVSVLVAAAPVAAQDEAVEGPPEGATQPEGAAQPEGEAATEDTGETTAPAEEEAAGEQDEAFLTDTEKAEIEAPEEEKNIGLHEDPDTPYFSVGARLRWIMIPEWFVNMFGVATRNTSDSALPLVSNVGAGPEFIYRKGGFDITVAIWYAGLGWDDTISFKEKGEDDNSWEVVDNSMHAILITADFMWSTSFTDWFAIIYGAGLGLGIPWGDIIRTEATGENFTEKCPDRCETDNCTNEMWTCERGEEYGKTYEKLKVIPWINFLGGVRFKPHRHVAIYVDGGFGMGFQIGTRVGYIF